MDDLDAREQAELNQKNSQTEAYRAKAAREDEIAGFFRACTDFMNMLTPVVKKQFKN